MDYKKTIATLELQLKQTERKLEKQRAMNRHKQKVIAILRIRSEKGLSKAQQRDSRERVNRLARGMED